MADYSNSLFSSEGLEPSLLPARFRLSSGQTRYSSSVTLDELTQLGFIGPFVRPSVPSTEKLVWSPTENTWDVIQKTELEIAQENDKTIRSSTEAILRNAVDVNAQESVLIEEVFIIYSEYYAKLNSLLNSTALLTAADLPTLSLPQIIYLADIDRIREEEVNRMLTENTEAWKYMYEDYGISGWEFDVCGDAEVAERFVKPSDWVASGTISN